MVKSVNEQTLIGIIVKEPTVNTTEQDIKVANFIIETEEVWTNSEGKKQSKKEQHHIIAWDKLAQVAQEYLYKGRKAYIKGRSQTINGKTETKAEKIIGL